jgi:hypothetical protein
LIALELCYALVSFAIGAVCALLAIAGVLDFKWSSLYGIASSLVGLASFISMGRQFFGWAISHYHGRADFSPEGVVLHIRWQGKTKETPIFWKDIKTVTHTRLPMNQIYRVFYGAKDSYIQFSYASFFRPKHLAREIAARAGKSLREA